MSRSLLLLFMVVGCGPPPGGFEPAPMAVSSLRIQTSAPSQPLVVAGAVTSWKTEEIGFDVAGRVEFVVEPESDAVGRRAKIEDDPQDGTLIARLNPERYELAVAVAEAKVEDLVNQRAAVLAEISDILPAKQRESKAALAYASSEYDRVKQLRDQGKGSVSQSEHDSALAERDASAARLSRATAEIAAKKSELASVEAAIAQAEDELSDARRNLQDCELRAPYDGLVATVYAIPGAYIGRGRPVVTLQMMNPIQIRVEVSPQVVQRLHYADLLPVQFGDGHNAKSLDGYLYQIDPVADPETRAYTVTLMLPNQQAHAPDNATRPTTRNLWRIYHDLLPGTDGKYFTEANSIHLDAGGHYVWKVTNRGVGIPGVGDDPVLRVAKARVEVGDLQVPFLGLWTFREVTPDSSEFDVEKNVLAGKLELPEGVESWTGDEIVLDQTRWMLRPGDLVRVNLGSDNTRPGFYVPIDVIRNDFGGKFVFALSGESGEATARKVAVRTGEMVGELIRIESTGDPPLTDGTVLVHQGAQRVVDGQRVHVVEEVPDAE